MVWRLFLITWFTTLFLLQRIYIQYNWTCKSYCNHKETITDPEQFICSTVNSHCRVIKIVQITEFTYHFKSYWALWQLVMTSKVGWVNVMYLLFQALCCWITNEYLRQKIREDTGKKVKAFALGNFWNAVFSSLCYAGSCDVTSHWLTLNASRF